MRPQTIQIFLPDGSPTSIREAELTNRLVKVILFPRNKMEEAGQRPLVSYTGVYFLFGKSEESLKPEVYIGEGEICFDRIKDHNKNKNFWTHCVIAGHKTDEYTKTDGKYLEHLGLKEAHDIGRYKLQNATGSKRPSLPESREHDLLDNFETIKILLSALGFPLFEKAPSSRIKGKDNFYINFQGLVATGDYIDEGFRVLKGSKARKEAANSFRKTQLILRQKLVDEGVLEDLGDRYIFKENYTFSSPSAASDMVKANSSNGWIEWKNKEDKTLDELKRK